MDKYTVDLDQVLNDFEYSELTTEQQPPAPLSSSAAAVQHPAKHYSSTKHSINNVFSSLNDYLNAEINENVVEYSNPAVFDNKYDNKSFRSTLSRAPLMPVPPASASEGIATGSIVEYPSVSNLYANAVSLEVADIGLDVGSNVRGVNMTPVKEKPLETLIAQPILLKIEDPIETNCEHVQLLQDKHLQKVEELSKGIETLLDANEKFKVLLLEDQLEVEEEVDDTEVSNSTEEEVILVPVTPNVLDTIGKQEQKVSETSEDVKLNMKQDIKYVDEQRVAEKSQEEEEELDVNDHQANEGKVEEVDVNSNMNNILVKSVDKANSTVQMAVLPGSPQDLSQMQSHCDKIGFHLEVADEEAARYLADLDDGDDDDDESFHDVPSPSTVQGTQEMQSVSTVLVSIIHDKTSNRVENALTSTNVTAPCEAKQDSAQDRVNVPTLRTNAPRPNNLDIKDANMEEPVNLIGNPGSTPYNNVYVSKEVHVEDKCELVERHGNVHVEYESESSTSVSPTFSEASTDSVHSREEGSPALRSKNADVVPAEVMQMDGASVAVAGEERQRLPEMEVVSITDVPCHELSELLEQEDVCVDVDGITGVVPVAETELEDPADADTEAVIEGDVAVHGHEHEVVDSTWLGKRAPLWVPDADALSCQHCELKFTVIKRRHHCRACGLVLCSKCCGMKHRLEYLTTEARVCKRCFDALVQDDMDRDKDSGSGDSQHSTPNREGESAGPASGAATNGPQPNPNNPMEYCSVVPPHQQVHAGGSAPSVMVPVGVLKRKGSNKKHNKSVMFCDGIRPGSDLTNLDQDFNYNEARKATSSHSIATSVKRAQQSSKVNKNLPQVDPITQSFIPENENCLPPTVTTYKSDITFTECGNNANVVEMLKNETLTFAVQRNLHIHVRLILMDCCVNKQAWCFSTEGLIAVGQDEVVILLEYIDNEAQVPKDVFHHLNNIYNSAVKGTTVTELGLSIHPTTNFLDSRNHAGFIFVRPTFQCLQHVIVPMEPYLVGVLVHRWETPWARIFPLRLVLRLGAEYRYYPAPLISTRHRDSVFVEIGHTIINLLADFRNFSYTLPNIRGLTIHMEEKSTTVSIPVNRYDQVMKSMSNSSEHILAFGGNFSAEADSHLVCIQDTQGSSENGYKTHAINIQNKPRKVTGASFIVFNGALKSSSGLTAKSSIVEDGLMIQIPPEHMVKVRDSLRNMRNHTIQCGCVNAASDETVNIVWAGSDVNFNIGVKSSVDGRSLSGVPSIRVHNGKDYTCNSGARLVRWTEVFLLQNGDENARTQDPVDISKVAESISKATCQALVKYLDLLATNSFMKIGIRTTLHVDDVSYSAGSNGQKLPPIYMKSLDNELVPVLHRITSSGNVGDGTIILELIFRILNA